MYWVGGTTAVAVTKKTTALAVITEMTLQGVPIWKNTDFHRPPTHNGVKRSVVYFITTLLPVRVTRTIRNRRAGRQSNAAKPSALSICGSGLTVWTLKTDRCVRRERSDVDFQLVPGGDPTALTSSGFDGDKPTKIIIHGWLGDSKSFDSVCTTLKAGERVCCLSS